MVQPAQRVSQAPIHYNSRHVSYPAVLSELHIPSAAGGLRARDHPKNHDH